MVDQDDKTIKIIQKQLKLIIVLKDVKINHVPVAMITVNLESVNNHERSNEL